MVYALICKEVLSSIHTPDGFTICMYDDWDGAFGEVIEACDDGFRFLGSKDYAGYDKVGVQHLLSRGDALWIPGYSCEGDYYAIVEVDNPRSFSFRCIEEDGVNFETFFYSDVISCRSK